VSYERTYERTNESRLHKIRRQRYQGISRKVIFLYFFLFLSLLFIFIFIFLPFFIALYARITLFLLSIIRVQPHLNIKMKIRTRDRRYLHLYRCHHSDFVKASSGLTVVRVVSFKRLETFKIGQSNSSEFRFTQIFLYVKYIYIYIYFLLESNCFLFFYLFY